MKVTKLKPKEWKEIITSIKENWGVSFPGKEYYFFKSGKGKIYLLNKCEPEMEIRTLRITDFVCSVWVNYNNAIPHLGDKY